MDCKGWIKLHRTLLKDDSTFQLLTALQQILAIHIILRANHQDEVLIDRFTGEKFIVKRGQLVTSREKIRAWFKGDPDVSEQRIKTALRRFHTLNFIHNEASKKHTILTVLNYEEYQKWDRENQDLQMETGFSAKPNQAINHAQALPQTAFPVTPNQASNQGLTNPLTSNKEDLRNNITPPTPPRGTERFEDFWTEYPKQGRTKKQSAKELWGRKKLDPRFDEIMAGLMAYKSSTQWQRDGGKYVPHACRFLRDERWKDECLTSKATVYESLSKGAI